jgi:hypothetical protein
MNLSEILDMLPPSISQLEEELGTNQAFDSEVFIQHLPQVVEEAQHEFIKYCVEEGVLSENFLNGKVSRQGIVGRYLDDGQNRKLYSVWYRFMCIDDNYKEWNQPYYAMNFEKYKNSGVSLNNHPRIKQFYRELKINNILDGEGDMH